VAVGDFNGDGKTDLAFPVAGRGVQVILGNGDGTFSNPITFPETAPNNLAVGDFNGDGKLDLLRIFDNTVDVLLGNGDGTFHSSFHTSFHGNSTSVAVGDFNGDGKLDFAMGICATTPCSSAFYGFVCIYVANGDGTFGILNHGQYNPNQLIDIPDTPFVSWR
jgi:hypothetical protein